MSPEDDARAPRPSRRRRAARSRAPLYALGGAIALAGALILYEARGTTLFGEELSIYQSLAAGADAEALLGPRDGHLVAVPIVLYELVLSAFGPDYVVFRLLAVAVLAALALVLWEYLRRRVDPWLALAPVVVVLFCGAAWEAILWPYAVLSAVLALAAGIGAHLLLERRDRGGDAGACALLVLAVACHSLGLVFVVGAAVILLWRRRNRRRAWVFAVPLALYGVWFAWALGQDGSPALDAVNFWLVPAYAAEALAVVLAALTGLGATVSGEGPSPTIAIEPAWGRVLAIAALIGLALRLARRRIPIALVATLAMLVLYWAMAALSLGPDRDPETSRFVLPGAVLVLLVAANALAGIRVPSAARIAVFVVALVAVATGIRQLHDGALHLRDTSLRARAAATGLAEARASVPPGYVPADDPALEGLVPPEVPLSAAAYLDAAREFDPIAFERGELADEPRLAREVAERVRVGAISAGAGVPAP